MGKGGQFEWYLQLYRLLATKAMKQRNKWWFRQRRDVVARVYAGQFIAATETKG